MPFPRVPKKPVIGQLKLIVKSPTTVEVETVDPREEFKDNKDLSEQVKFKLPRGFSVVTEVGKYMEDQKKRATRKLVDLRRRTEGCKSCRRGINVAAIERAQEIIDHSCDYLKTNADTCVRVLVGYQKDGAVTLNFIRPDTELGVVVYPDSFEFGRYFKGSLMDETGVVLTASKLTGGLAWVAAE